MVVERCPNIGPKERLKRLHAGYLHLGIALIAAAVMLGTGIPRGYRLLLFLPFWGAGAGVFQYLEKT